MRVLTQSLRRDDLFFFEGDLAGTEPHVFDYIEGDRLYFGENQSQESLSSVPLPAYVLKVETKPVSHPMVGRLVQFGGVVMRVESVEEKDGMMHAVMKAC